jgi:hypothetical protein
MKKSTPNLPASSRMQMPVGGGMKTPSMPITKNTSLKKGSKKAAVKKPSMK